jgi:hypothetical protein
MTPPAETSDESWPALGGYRVAAVALFVAVIAGFVTAVVAEFALSGTPAARAVFWTGVAALVAGSLGLPLLLFRVLHLRGLERLERRLWTMRAVWGGPFGALGALWDLSGSRRVRAL